MRKKLEKSLNEGIELTLSPTHLVIRIPVQSKLIPLATAFIGAGEPPYMPPQTKKAFEALRKGLTNKEIGNQLGISERTVKYHMTEIFRRTNLNDRGEVLKLFGYSQ